MVDCHNFDPQIFFPPQIFLSLPTILQDHNIFCNSSTIFRRYNFCGSVGGIVNNKENIAIASKEQQMLKDMLRVPDSKGLTVWSDKETHCNLMKSDSFLKANDRAWKYIDTCDESVVAGMSTKVDISSGVGSPDSPVVSPGISGEISSNRMVEKMINYFRLRHLFEVEYKISLNTRIPPVSYTHLTLPTICSV